MPLSHEQITELAGMLDLAVLQGKEIERLTSNYPELSLEEAYRIQDEGICFRLKRRELPVGLKMGLTSQAKREQMGLHSPIYGVLTNHMQIQNGGRFALEGSIHPKIEPEIAFRVAREVRGRISAEEALEACSSVCAALEILDSRFVGFRYFSLPDVVADNCSSSRFVLGEEVRSFRHLELDRLEMVLEVNGVPAHTTLSNAISGNPIQSLVQLCEILDSRGLSLPAGSIVLAGAATPAVALESGMNVRLRITGLPEAKLSIQSAQYG